MITVRPWDASDDLSELTKLLHRAYAPLAAANMRYVATHQTDKTTLHRIGKGTCFVAEEDGVILGTVCYYRTGKGHPHYEQPHVAQFSQFAVEPDAQGRGIGKLLLERVAQSARDDGATELALDTSEHAEHLIALYKKWGYRVVGEADWDATNYKSVILSKAL